MDKRSALVKCLTFFSSLLARRAIGENTIAARYEGCAWCDSTEQQLVDAIITSIRTRPQTVRCPFCEAIDRYSFRDNKVLTLEEKLPSR